MATPIHSWDAPEFIRNPRTADWYWAISLMGAAGVFASIYYGNYLFGGVILLSAVLLIMASVRPVHTYKVELFEKEMAISGKRIAYEKLSGFWINEHPREGYKLLIKSDKIALPVSVIALTDKITPEEVRAFFHNKVDETEITIPILVQVFEEIF